jgi:hypothetical protein
LYVDASNDRVGIGKANPGQKLEISETNFNITTQNTAILLGGGSGGAGEFTPAIGFKTVDGGTPNAKATISGVQGSVDQDNMGLAFHVHSSGVGSADLEEAMRITYEGNVGIGTTAPTDELNVVGNLNVTGNIELTNLYDSDATNFFDNTCTYGVSSISSTGALSCASQQGTGSGTVSSGAINKLAYYASAGTTIDDLTGSANGAIYYGGSSTVQSGTLPVVSGGTGVTTKTGTGNVVLSATPTFTGTLNAATISITGDMLMTDDNYIGISGAERIQFDTAGDVEIMGADVGIGTADPGYKLDVNGTGRFSDDVRLDAGKNLNFYDHDASYPTATGGFVWDLNNDNAKIYAQQPASDQIDFVFKIADNVGTTDRFVYWIDSYTGETDDIFPLYMDGTKAVFNYPSFYGSGNSKNMDFYIIGNGSTSTSQAYFFGDAANKRIGIGTTAPTDELNVVGNLNVTGNIELTNLYDSDATNFFDNTCTYGVSSISSTGALSCASQQGTGSMSSWTIAGDDDSSTVSDGQTATIAGSGTIDTAQNARTITISVQANSIGAAQLADSFDACSDCSGTFVDESQADSITAAMMAHEDHGDELLLMNLRQIQ